MMYTNYVKQESSVDLAKKAKDICMQSGIKQGTRLFYRCFRKQLSIEEYNNKVAQCESENNIIIARRECFRRTLGIPIILRKRAMVLCVNKLINECKSDAYLEYLKNNKEIQEKIIHNYSHHYYHINNN